MAATAFVPNEFEPPLRLETPDLLLVPLGPEVNEGDYAAWTSSLDHIRATPGLAGWGWPHEMSLDENRRDLEMHARHFTERRGFTYTVLEPASGDVIGCVYIYPPREGEPAADAVVRSWVRADRAALDAVLWATVGSWLRDVWPFHDVVYAAR